MHHSAKADWNQTSPICWFQAAPSPAALSPAVSWLSPGPGDQRSYQPLTHGQQPGVLSHELNWRHSNHWLVQISQGALGEGHRALGADTALPKITAQLRVCCATSARCRGCASSAFSAFVQGFFSYAYWFSSSFQRVNALNSVCQVSLVKQNWECSNCCWQSVWKNIKEFNSPNAPYTLASNKKITA